MTAFAAIIASLGRVWVAFLANDLVKWIAIKLVLTALFVVILPIILNNFMYDIINTLFTFANSKLGESGGFSQVLEISGVAAYLADKFQLVSCFAVLLSAISLRLALRHIPWIRI